MCAVDMPACLYYSVVCMQVNVIPVIAKADTISRSELSQFKARVRRGKEGCGDSDREGGLTLMQ